MRRQRSEFEELGAEVVTISFGPASRVPAWLEETGSPFPLLIDRKREAYEAYAVSRSFSGSWNLKTLKAYRELMKQGCS